ncbi:MAG: hypothetical protein F6K00_02425 [Leptolyngbya sp. SIOISBB]|nr:hypothetical protein [Leptolyngbya sp. SIOISBB]
MSLSAVVYLDRKNLESNCIVEEIEVDDLTGEVYSENEETQSLLDNSNTIAISLNLGNMEMVGYLSQSLSKFLSSSNSIILNKVLYNGSHSGDALALSDVQKLKDEVSSVMVRINDNDFESTRKYSEILGFLEKMSELIRASEVQKNPIVFV